MTSVEVPFALPWLVFAAAWLGIGCAAVLVARMAHPLLARIDAEQRSTLLLALAVLPPTVAALVAVLGFVTTLGGALIDTHCHPDVGCVAHVPILHTTLTHAAWLAGAVLLATGSLIWSIGGRLRRSVVLSGTLNSLAEPSDRTPFKVVESAQRFAYCVGLLRPTLLVSRGVLELPPAQRDAVIAHESAHAVRRDNLRRWVARVSLWPLPRRASDGLLRQLADANEQACDRIASDACGKRHLIDALATFGNDSAAKGSQPAAEIDARLRALADGAPGVTLSPVVVGALIIATYVTCALVALDAAHHGSELLLGWL